jgi:hypothetical protein
MTLLKAAIEVELSTSDPALGVFSVGCNCISGEHYQISKRHGHCSTDG